MRSAVYYPHTEFRHKSLLKTSLLLWDHLYFIVPFADWSFNHGDPEVEEALEIIGRKICPSERQKQAAHEAVLDFATNTLHESFYYRDRRSSQYYEYGMWPQKFLPQTWDALKEVEIVGRNLANSHYPLQDSAGLALMSILADCCAGKTKARVTDRGAAYAALTNLMVGKPEYSGDSYDLPIPVTLNAIDTSEIPLRNLI